MLTTYLRMHNTMIQKVYNVNDEKRNLRTYKSLFDRP